MQKISRLYTNPFPDPGPDDHQNLSKEEIKKNRRPNIMKNLEFSFFWTRLNKEAAKEYKKRYMDRKLQT